MKLEGFSNYEIYPEEGKIWSYKSNRFIGSIRPSGYYSVSLSDDNGNLKVYLLHRIIWKAVNGEIPYGYDIHHIDECFSHSLMLECNISYWIIISFT